MSDHAEIAILAILTIMLVGITALGVLDKRRDVRHVVALTSARLERVRTVLANEKAFIRVIRPDYDIRVVCETRVDYERFDAEAWLRKEIAKHPERWQKYVHNVAVNRAIYERINDAIAEDRPSTGYAKANRVCPMSAKKYREVEWELLREILPDVVTDSRYHVIAHYDDLASERPLERETVFENDAVAAMVALHYLNANEKEREEAPCDTAAQTSDGPTPDTGAS